MTLVRRLVAGLVAVAAAGCALSPAAAAAGPATRSAAPDGVDRVVIVAIPGLGWDDVSPQAMPALSGLADRGATAALSVKTVGRRTSRPQAYATIGAGARADAPGGAAGSARGVDEQLASGRTAGEEAAAAGHPPGDAAIVVLGTDAIASANRERHRGARIGALGRVVVQHGWDTAVVANHDGPGEIDRVAGLAPTTRWGSIDRGSVAPDLTVAGPDGLRRSDPVALEAAFAALPTRRLVALVEIGDVAWADAPSHDESARRDAVARTDAALGSLVERLGPRDLLIVLAPTAPAGRDQPTPFVMAGPGVVPGAARSATTRKAGYVTLPDIGPTVLERIGADVPGTMDGTPITAQARATTGAQRVAGLQRTVAEQRFVDRSTGILLSTLPIVFAAWCLLALLATIVPLGSAAPVARGFVRWIGLGMMAMPTIVYLAGVVSVRTWGQPAWALAVWGAAGVVSAALLLLRPPSWAPVALAGATWAVQVGDVVTGAHLQFGTALGNSPTVAGRFSGMGNNAFALLAASTLVVAVVAWQAVEARRPGWPALSTAGAVFAVAIVVDGAPGLGSDVGGVLTLGPVAALTLWSLAGRRISTVRVALSGLATLVALVALVALDLARPVEDQSHLGRLVRRVGHGGGLDVIWRKADAALGSVTGSSLVWNLASTALLAGFLWWLARPAVERLIARPQARVLVTSAVAMGVLGAALNDSGVMVPAIMATVFVPAVVHLLLAPRGPAAAPVPRTWPWSADRAEVDAARETEPSVAGPTPAAP